MGHKAAVYAGTRKIDLAMVAIPMGEKLTKSWTNSSRDEVMCHLRSVPGPIRFRSIAQW